MTGVSGRPGFLGNRGFLATGGLGLTFTLFRIIHVEDGGVDTTVIKSQQHQLGQMADFHPLLIS